MNPILQSVDALLTSQQYQIDALTKQTESPLVLLTSLEAQKGWQQPGNVGNDGGANSKPHGTYSIIRTPDGWTRFSIFPHKPANDSERYDDFYFYLPLTPLVGSVSQITKLVATFKMRCPTAKDLVAMQQWETEMQQRVSDLTYNMAWACNIAESKKYQPFDYANSKWLPGTVPVDMSAFAPSVTFEYMASFVRTKDNALTHQTLSTNGTAHAINLTQAGVKRDAGDDYLNIAFQLDGNYSGDPYSVDIKDMTVILA